MSNLPQFGAYAAAFEKTLLDNDWSQLEQYFADNATCLPGDGTEALGRAACIEALKASVARLEGKCDSRELIEQPEITESGDRITLQYAIRYNRSDIEAFDLRGIETIDYVDGKIVRMEDVFEDPAALDSWASRL